MDEELQKKLNHQLSVIEKSCKPIRKPQAVSSLRKTPVNIIQTLDNPQVLEQQLEALEYHKKVLERREQYHKLVKDDKVYVERKKQQPPASASVRNDERVEYSTKTEPGPANLPTSDNVIYSNIKTDDIPSSKKSPVNHLICNQTTDLNSSQTTLVRPVQEFDDEPCPSSPVSSSYSELIRATTMSPTYQELRKISENIPSKLANSFAHKDTNYQSDYSPYNLSSRESNYESIYEPINPRTTSQLSSRSNYSLYTPYANIGSDANLSFMDEKQLSLNENCKNVEEDEVDALTNMLVQSLNVDTDQIGRVKKTPSTNADYEQYADTFGVCVRCGERVIGEQSGCTAMDQIYHITCFSCSRCQINLQGKPFYALNGQPCCEEDYVNTLEKCSVCMKPILERILRATGKPYHPDCFCCVVCGKSLDGIPFTVDATNQNHCIEDFHKKFAPRCCVCMQPIMPENGKEETIRIVALDRSFHVQCYGCEDCGLLLTNGDEGHGCFPLDGHILCQSCNAIRVQALTSKMTTEL